MDAPYHFNILKTNMPPNKVYIEYFLKNIKIFYLLISLMLQIGRTFIKYFNTKVT